jgi:ankyrin repeat protein
METIKNTKKLIIVATIASLLAPALSRSAALPEESNTHISPEIQDILDKHLCRALDEKNYPDVEKNLGRGANPNSTHPLFDSSTPLSKAIRSDNIDLVNILIKAGADFKKEDYLSEAISHYRLHPHIITALINAGVDINGETYRAHKLPQKQRYRRSPLLNATDSPDSIPYEHIQIIQQLIDANADLNIQNHDGQTALTCLVSRRSATDYTSSTIIKALLLAGADATIRDKKRHNALYYAAHDPNMIRIVQEALEEREKRKQVPEKHISAITRINQDQFLQQAHHYLVNAPLSIDALTQIFLEYATETDPVKLQQQKAKKTEKEATEWQANRNRTLQIGRIEREQQILREEAAAVSAQRFEERQRRCEEAACKCCIITVCCLPYFLTCCCCGLLKNKPLC